MIDEIISSENNDVIKDLIQSNTRILHEDRSQSIKELYDNVKQIFVPFVLN